MVAPHSSPSGSVFGRDPAYCGKAELPDKMKAVHGVFAVSILSIVCHAGLIPLETIKSVAHPKYKPDTYAQFGDHDVDCGHVSYSRTLCFEMPRY